MLTKGIDVDDHPLLEFMDEVKRWIPCAWRDHNVASPLRSTAYVTEMLYGVITTFHDLAHVAKVKLPDWYDITASSLCGHH